MSGMRRPVAVIIGMMGAGKTRVGKEVAQMMQSAVRRCGQ